MFPQDNRPSVSQYGEVSELMTGIGLCKRSGSLGNEIPRKKMSTLLLACLGKIQSDLIGQFWIENNDLRLTDRSRLKFGEKYIG